MRPVTGRSTSAFVRLQARFDAFVVEELFHALLTAAFGVKQA
jgi:hypothetical protein